MRETDSPSPPQAGPPAPGSAGEPTSPALRWGTGIGLCVLAFALRWPSASLNSMWMDELYTAYAVSRDLGHAWAEVLADVHPPIYTLLVHGWTLVFGAGEASLEASTVVFGTAAVALAYAAMLPAFGWKRALACAGLMVVLPRHVLASWELRPYALGLGLSVAYTGLVSWSLHVEPEARTRAAALHGLAIAALMYTHYAFVLLVAAGWVSAWWFPPDRTWRERCRDAGVTAVIASLLYAPWLPVAWRHLHEGNRWIPPADAARVFDYFNKLFAASTLQFLTFGLAIAVFLAFAVAEAREERVPSSTPQNATLLLMTLLPPTLATVISWVPGAPSLLAGKTALLWSGPLFVACVVPLATWPRLPLAPLGLALIACGWTLGTSGIYTRPYRPDNRAAAAYVASVAEAHPESVLVMTSQSRPELFDFYLAPYGLHTHAAAYLDRDLPRVWALLDAHPEAETLIYITATNRPSQLFLQGIGSRAQGYAQERRLHIEIHRFELRPSTSDGSQSPASGE